MRPTPSNTLKTKHDPMELHSGRERDLQDFQVVRCRCEFQKHSLGAKTIQVVILVASLLGLNRHDDANHLVKLAIAIAVTKEVVIISQVNLHTSMLVIKRTEYPDLSHYSRLHISGIQISGIFGSGGYFFETILPI